MTSVEERTEIITYAKDLWTLYHPPFLSIIKVQWNICLPRLLSNMLKWFLVGSLTSSGKYFMHIHDDNKVKNIYRLYRNEGGMGHCVNDFWKSMMSWKRTDNISFCRKKCSSSFPKYEGTAEHPKHITNNSPQTVYFCIETTNRPDIIYQSTVSMHH